MSETPTQPSPLMPATKGNLAKSEATLNMLAVLGATLAPLLAKSPGTVKWVSLGVAVVMAVVYAVFHTPLAAQDRPGWKTKTFWVSLVTVVGSAAAAVAETDIAGIPAKVTQIAGLVVAAVAAMGYTIWRSSKKKAS